MGRDFSASGPDETWFADITYVRTRRGRAALEIFEYIECLYDRVRTHSALGHPSPEEFEARTRKGAARAA